MVYESPRTRERIVRLLLLLVERPYQYTLKQLADKFLVSTGTIKGDFKVLADVGLVLRRDDRYRYSLQQDSRYKELRDLLHFTAEEQFLLYEAIDQITPHSQRGAKLKRKLGSLYDYSKLGNAYLRKPYLNKVDALLKAKHEKKQVVLQNYKSSNSNVVSDRLVEPFHPSPPEDILHAWDVDLHELRHFRISRIQRVLDVGTDWQHQNHHQILRTDPFRIVDNDQVMVHLRMKVGALNELLERYPLTKAHIIDEGNGIYDFQCEVNHRFIGLTNFILGYHHQLVEVLAPDSLIEHLILVVGKMGFVEE